MKERPDVGMSGGLGMPTKSRVVFLAGMGRSGSTLLERLLGETAVMVPLGEVLHVWQRGVVDNDLCGCGQPFRECEFWSAVGDGAFGGWGALDVDRIRELRSRVDRALKVPLLARSTLSDEMATAVSEYSGYYAALYAAAIEVSGKSVVIDSSKQVSLPFCLSWSDRLDLKVLHCVRDSRAVVHAWTKIMPRPEARDPNASMPTYSPAAMCAYWTLHNAEIDLLGKRNVQHLRVRYEDLVTDPTGVLGAVLDFLGLSTPLPFLRGHTVELNPRIPGLATACVSSPVQLRSCLTMTGSAIFPRLIAASLPR
ncbi:MAG: sulfotransferase [Nocardioidaceae bacterium]